MMRTTAAGTALLAVATVALASPQIARPTRLALPGGDAGIGFDDLMFSSSLHRVSVAVAADSHCVATDDAGHAYVCDPRSGALLVVTDPFPATKK